MSRTSPNNGSTGVGESRLVAEPYLDAPSPAQDPMSAPPRGMPGPSVKLAVIVVGLAVVVIVAGLAAQVFTGSTKPAAAPTSVKTAKGAPFKAIPAVSDLSPLISDGEPPADIVNALVLPKGSAAGATINDSLQAQGYDEQREFTIDGSQGAVLSFFKLELPAEGWHVDSSGPAKNQPGIEVLAERAGSDGYYWEIGAVVAPTTFPSSGPAAKTGITKYEVTLFQVSDTT